MAIEVTEQAAEVLRRSLVLGRVDPATGGVRLRGARGLGSGFDIQVELAEGPGEGEATIELEGLRIFVGTEVTATIPDAVVSVEPEHDRIVVRPAGAEGAGA
jgi:uncharacterized protein YneR